MDSNDLQALLAMLPDDKYDPSAINLIGAHMAPSPISERPGKDSTQRQRDDYLEKLCTGEMKVRSDFAHQLTLLATPKISADEQGAMEIQCPTIALIYAYGYEGHTYRLSKPRIMIVSGEGSPYEASAKDDDSGAVLGKLFVWSMSKHANTISIEVESGALEKLVLDANQPGNRAVNSYAAHMQMSHRGGKLS